MARGKVRLDNYRLLTGDMGQLLPTGCVEVLPGDTFRHSSTALVRFSPMAAPVMHPIRVRQAHFFVPHRLVWDEEIVGSSWEDFITGGPDGNDASIVPKVGTTGTPNDLWDYFGFPVAAGVAGSTLPIRGYNMIWNEWFRDQDLQPEHDLAQSNVEHVAWSKDYFTTARPWPQKGEAVTLPLGTHAPVYGDGQNAFHLARGSADASADTVNAQADGTLGVSASAGIDNMYAPDFQEGTGLIADLSNATAATIDAIRRASALQRFAENRARFGSRYAEYVRHMFGARPLDARLQRPEYLGGSSQSVSVSEVMNTTDVSGDDPRNGVGDMYGHGIAAGRSNAYRRRFNEHGYVISLLWVRPKAIYTNGVDRSFLRTDREDFYQQELAHIGQQQVLEQEVYANPTNADDVFGYSDRYQEYRYQRSAAVGEFRNVLDYWHLGRNFQAPPALNADFIKCEPSKRIFNEQTQHSLWMAVDHRIRAVRRISRSSTPRLV